MTIWPSLSVVLTDPPVRSRETWMRCRGGIARPGTALPSGSRPGVLDVGEGVVRALTGDPGGHLLPEGPRAHGAGHLVGAVEAEDRLGVLEDLAGQPVDRAGQVVGVQTLVGAGPAAGGRRRLGLLVRPDVGRQVGLEGLHLRTVVERGHELARAEDRLAEVVV